MHEHCLAFTDAAEHRMEYTALFEDYEEKMEAALQAFARQEGLSTREVYERFSDGKGESTGTDNNAAPRRDQLRQVRQAHAAWSNTSYE